MIDLHTPGIILLMETPMHPRQGAITRILHNNGCKTHCHLAISPSPADTLPEARLPPHTTHSGGGCWIAYKTQTPWATIFCNLPLPGTCPKATTCAIELTLNSGDKAAIVACYLPQATDEHSRSCKALARLTYNLPHHLSILGGDFQANYIGPNAKDDHVRCMSYKR
jgi:hypothetical protein